MMKKIWAKAKELTNEFLATDNTKVNTGTIFASVGFITGLAVVIFYAFYLQKDIGDNMSNVLMALMGVGGTGFVATLLAKYGGTVNVPPSKGKKGDE